MTELALAVIYALIGTVLWRIIVLPRGDSGLVPNADQASDDRELDEWQQVALAEETNGCLALMIPKATFILLWPLALGIGFVCARFTD